MTRACRVRCQSLAVIALVAIGSLAGCILSPGPAAADACAATATVDGRVHVPIIRVDGQGFFWADLSYVVSAQELVVVNAGAVADTSPFAGCAPAAFSPDLRLHIPAIVFDQATYWADLQYAQGSSLTLIGAGRTSPIETSYANFKEVGLTPQVLPPGRSGVGTVRAYGDFCGAGRLDLFTATLTYWPPTTPAAATPGILEFWCKQDDGTFARHTEMLASTDGSIHPRKAIVADFNGDGRPDIFVASHGFDAPPFPGERSKVVLSQPGGAYITQDASADVGFFHSASAADLNGDGLPDVMVTNNFDPASVFVLINQGGGVFQREPVPRLPAIGRKPYFSVELMDVDGDGNLDVVLGGHEWEGATTLVLLGSSGASNWTSAASVAIPPVAGEGVVLDFVVTGSGAGRTLWLLRTSGGDGTFYQSRTIQKVLWPSLSTSVPLQERPAAWFPWIIPTTVDGRSVIASEDVSVQVAIPQ